MKRPDKKDFEYYQKHLVFKTVNLVRYSEAQDKFIDYSKIDWEILREKYFKECTYTPEFWSEVGLKKINLAPHDLFEWFRKNIEL